MKLVYSESSTTVFGTAIYAIKGISVVLPIEICLGANGWDMSESGKQKA